MTGFIDNISPLHEDIFEEEIKQSQRTIAEKSRKLDAMKLERIRAEEDTVEYTKEGDRRVVLVVEIGAVGDVLLEFRQLLQREEDLAEMLRGPIYRKLSKGRTRDPSNPLQDMEDCASQKAEGLRSQVLAVKQTLEDMRFRSVAKSIIEASTTKPKRKRVARK